MAETKPKTSDALRIPKAKKKLGISVPPALRLPHEDLIVPLKDLSSGDHSTMPSQTSLTRHSHVVDSKSELSRDHTNVSPQRDFTKVANSINREAVPAGLFTGKSKQLYDCLYMLTRGAMVPSRSVRISRPNLMKRSHIGSRVTFDTNIERLIRVGLINVNKITGEHKGNEYVVYLPEEVASSPPSLTSHSSMTSQTSHAQKLVRLVSLETSQTSHSTSPLNTTAYDTPNTFFNTNDDDTHTVSGFVEEILLAARAVVGEKLRDSEQERKRWKQLGKTLADELKLAADKASPISSVPAFFEAHLRRRLNNSTQQGRFQNNAASRNSADTDKSVERESNKPALSELEQQKSNKSKFSVEECRRYADHLHQTNQGILNPGGYATTIHRTGEVDALVSSFLEDRVKESGFVAAKECPDCNGTGYWYPQGKEKGVARCRHENLKRDS